MCVQVRAVAAEMAASVDAPKKLWGGRFTGATDPLMEKFNESLPFDQRMWSEDIRVSRPAALCNVCLCSAAIPTYREHSFCYRPNALHVCDQQQHPSGCGTPMCFDKSCLFVISVKPCNEN